LAKCTFSINLGTFSRHPQDNDETESDGATPLETVSHILYNCPKYIQIRLDIYHERFPDENTVFNKGFHHNAKRLINFLKKTECLSRKPKLSNADLSPNANKGQKRKKSQTQSNPIKPSKQTKLTHFMTI
jgi:hypothetical protein